MSLTVGVLGGMGPAATVDFLGRLVAVTPALRETDHLRVLVDSNPRVPDRNRAIAGNGPSPGPVLGKMARGLVAQGAELLCMSCNAAHAWAAEIREAVAVPFVSMVEATARAAAAAGGRPGLLAVDATRAAGLYDLPDMVSLDAADQADFMALIGRIKAGDTGRAASADMAALARSLVDRGATLIVAACTEVPLVLDAAALSMPVLDPTELLAREVVARARGTDRAC